MSVQPSFMRPPCFTFTAPTVAKRAAKRSSPTAAKRTFNGRRGQMISRIGSGGDYLHFRRNPLGAHREMWFHAAGCRRYFNVVRDTASYQILEVYP